MKEIKDLCVPIEKYTKDGQQKCKWQKIGVEITEEKDGEKNSFILLDRFINLSGFPNFSDKVNQKSVLVSKFDNDEAEENIKKEKVEVF